MLNCSASCLCVLRGDSWLRHNSALAIPGTPYWKNHPGLYTARSLFPGHLRSRPHCSRWLPELGGWEGEPGRGVMGKESRRPFAEMSWGGVRDLSLRAPDHQQPCSVEGAGSAVSSRENDDLIRTPPRPALSRPVALSQVPYRKASFEAQAEAEWGEKLYSPNICKLSCFSKQSRTRCHHPPVEARLWHWAAALRLLGWTIEL